MQELSMNVLDVAENSVAAGSTLTTIAVEIDTAGKKLAVTIADNGRGMSQETVKKAADPFYTTRTTRRVGLGLPFFREAAESAGGTFSIRSELGKGTTVSATFALGNIDLAPLGDMSGTIISLVQCNPDIDFIYRVRSDGDTFTMDTRELRAILGDVPLSTPQVAVLLRSYLEENTENLLKRSTQI